MPSIAHSGRGRVSVRRPRALGESDRSGFWYPLDEMVRQFEWAGNTLVDTGLLVGPDEVDVPQDQYRAPILPADPYPRINPRPSPAITQIPIIGQPLPTTPGNLGFTQFVLNASVQPLYPISKIATLARVAILAGIPTPLGLLDRSIVTGQPNRSVQLMPANTGRSWLLLYNPAVPQAQVAEAATATWGLASNLILGPGEAYFMASAQMLGAAYQGALALISLHAGIPFLAWEGGDFINDGGVLQLVNTVGFPTSPVGLAPGGVWNDALAVGIYVLPGATPNPLAPLVRFGTITAAQLLALGGGNLPTTSPVAGSGYLWNDGGLVVIA